MVPVPVSPETDETLEYGLPFMGDLAHSRETILRLLTVLYDREKEYREEFRALLDLIDNDTAVGLQWLIKGAFLDYIDRALEIHNRLRPVEQKMPAFPADLSGRNRLLDGPLLPSENPAMYALLTAPELICRPVSEVQEELSSRKAAELLPGYGTDKPYAPCSWLRMSCTRFNFFVTAAGDGTHILTGQICGADGEHHHAKAFDKAVVDAVNSGTADHLRTLRSTEIGGIGITLLQTDGGMVDVEFLNR